MTGSDRIEERKKRKEASFRVSTAAEQAGRRGARLFSGAVVLAMAGIFVKVLGMIYKIPLTNLLGDEGMGYFNAAYTIYTLFFVLATSGMPVALSLLISESLARGEEKRAGQIYRAASRLFLLVGIGGTLLMALPARRFAALLGNEEAAAGILAVSPTLAFITVTSALRGYFQGHGNMVPTAVSQVIEAAGKLFFGMALALAAISRYPLSTTSAYAIFGLTLATFFAMLYLLIAKRRFDRNEYKNASFAGEDKKEEKKGRILVSIVKIALPVTISASAMTLASSLDLFLVMRTLQDSGYSAAEANAAWGNYSSLAVPLFNMPTVLILPIAYAVSPYVRAALASQNFRTAKNVTRRALSFAALLALPAALGLSVLSEPILSLIYTDKTSVATAAPLLAILALAVFSLALLSVTSALLQAYGKLWFPIAAIGVGVLVKLAVSRIVMLSVGMPGAPIGTFACYGVVAALDLAYLSHVTGGLSLLPILLRSFAASLPTALLAAAGYRLFRFAGISERPAVLLAVLAAVLLFLLMVRLLGCFTREDAEAFGVSEKMIARLEKLGFWKKSEL